MKVAIGSGGGPKGAWSAGVWRALAEAGWLDDVRTYLGVSVNWINLCYLAQEGPEGWQKLWEMWKVTANDDVWKHWMVPYIPALWKGGAASIEPLRHFLGQHLKSEKLKASESECLAGYVDLHTWEMKYGSSKADNFMDAGLASTANPIWFEPVMVDGHWCTDGGVIDVTPMPKALALGATEVIAVTHSPAKREAKDTGFWAGSKRPGIVRRTCRELMIAMEARLDNDLTVPPGVKLDLIRPEKELEVELPNFDPEVSQRLLEEGYEAGKVYVEGRMLSA